VSWFIKSVVLVASSGFWFCNSLVSSVKKSVEVSEDDGFGVVDAKVLVDADVTDETVMANSGSLRRAMHDGTRSQVAVVKVVREIKRTASRIQARIRMRGHV
jgi:hypothetical protein